MHCFLEGSNASILAYGQTSSGKTHSILGTPYEAGLLPLAVEEVFRKAKNGGAKLSYYEIFNEKAKRKERKKMRW